YFNSLLNRPSDSQIDTAFDVDQQIVYAQKLLHNEIKTNRREELSSLKQVLSINEILLNKDERHFIPKLSGFVDVGSQAEDMKFNRDSRYYMIGLQLDIPIFSGFRNKYKIKEAKLDLQNSKLAFENASKQLELSAGVAKNKLKSALEVYHASLEQLKAADSYQRLINRGYEAGVNSF